MGKHITVLVSNDLQHDQRVAKVCATLLEMGFRITLVGRLLPDSKPFERPYETRRFRLPFQTGALFYAALNVRFFFYLLFKRTDIIVANDLDTLLPAFLIAHLKRRELVYDSHEYFTEAEGLTNRPLPKKVWLAIEGFIFPKLKYVITVNETIAGIYRALYHVPVHVVRNVPMLREQEVVASRDALGLPSDKRIILLQGAYIDPDRGGMELAQSIVSLDKPLHLNYAYSLPNKLFDYIHAGLPVLVSDLPELRRIVEGYNLGRVLSRVEPREIATALQEMFSDENGGVWKLNALKAAKELNWQREQEVVRKVYEPLR